MLADHSWLRAGARAPGTRRTRQFQVQSNPGQQQDKVQPIPGQQPGGQSKTHPWSAAEWMGGSQPTPGGRRGPRTPAVVRSALACCGGHCRGRCGSFFPSRGRQLQEAVGARGGAPRGQEPGGPCSVGFPSSQIPEPCCPPWAFPSWT